MANLAPLGAAVFFAICEKPEGADNRPPAVRGLMYGTVKKLKYYWLLLCMLLCIVLLLLLLLLYCTTMYVYVYWLLCIIG